MSSFFTIPGAQKKRKRTDAAAPPKKRVAATTTKTTKPAHTPKQSQRDEEISGSESDSDDGPRPIDESEEEGSESEAEDETAAERRLRLAERYLDNIREEVDEVGFDAEDIDRDLIAERLEEDVAESKGRIYRALAEQLEFGQASSAKFRSDCHTITGIATCAPYAYTVSKDLWLHKWRIQELPQHQVKRNAKGKKMKKQPPPKRRPEAVKSVRGNKKNAKDNNYKGHVDNILCVAASEDGKFVVTGGRDRRIIVWDASTLEPLRVFGQHRDAVTGLAFRRGTNQLYSSSKDRTIKIWSLNELAYVETLFGHQDEVVDIAALAQERCISVGARDRTARLWKVVEETQLVFRGGGGEKKRITGPRVLEGSMDRVAMIDEEMFITGGDNGSISLWVTHKKKPIYTLSQAHGIEEPVLPEDVSAEAHPNEKLVPAPQPRWITALKTIPYSDVILSGSWDGSLRAWKVSEDRKKIESVGIVGSVPASEVVDSEGGREIRGVINDIAVFERGDRGKDGVCIVCAVGKEHRFGRWIQKTGKNCSVVLEVPRLAVSKKEAKKDDNEDED